MPRKPKQPPIVCEYFRWRVFQRRGVYYADGRGGRHHLGKHSLATRDRGEALENLRRLDRQKAFELGLADTKHLEHDNPVSIAEGWQLYLEYSGRSGVLGGVAAKSLQRYKAVRDKHVQFCVRHGVETWNVFDKRMVEQYASWLGKGHAHRTVYFELTLLKSVNSWLIENRHLPADCKIHYSLRKPQGTDTYCYRPDEVAAMVEYCQAVPKLNWLAHVIIALAHTGLRISELAGLRWSDVDHVSNTLRVADERSSKRKQEAGTARTTKGRRSRTLPIHPQLRELLQTLEPERDGRVFHAQLGGPLRQDNVRYVFVREVIEPLKARFPTPEGEIGFAHGRLHSFRHFFCSQAFLGGASEGEIKEWLGHADSKMVEHYRHLRDEDSQRKMKQIDFLGRNGERIRRRDEA